MAEIRIKESTFMEHAVDLSEAGQGDAYEPLSSGNMSYSRANSINDLRTAVMESIEVMNQVTQLSEKDA
ncbi:DUF3130 family protein, partial [Listeria valentina]|uniref:DUF3130 family protein n=1 Tax=Listeria valentina TaxID=2705293 RepID=UPI001430A0AE